MLANVLKSTTESEIFLYDISLSTNKDVRMLPSVESQLKFCSQIEPEVFIHLGAQTDVLAGTIDPNIDASLNIMSTLSMANYISRFQPNCHFIYVNSGGAIYGDSEFQTIDEDYPTAPSSFYGLSKLVGENYVKMFGNIYGLKWSSLALSNVYGPGNPEGIFHAFISALKSDITPTIYGPKSSRDYVHIDDVIRAIIEQTRIVTRCRVHISSGIETSNIEIFEAIKVVMKKDTFPKIDLPRNGEVIRIALSNKLAHKLLNWKPQIELLDAIPSIVNSY
jgi:UDP-glucose 4-epimerase